MLYLYRKTEKKEAKKRKIDHFAECLNQYTRQSGLPQDSTTVLCRVLKPWHSAKFQTFAECQDPALGKAATWRHPGLALCRVSGVKLCRVSAVRHSAKCRPRVAPRGCFAESRQSLCRVPEIRHSAKNPLPWEALPSVTLGKEFAECKLAFPECNRYSAKPVNPVV